MKVFARVSRPAAAVVVGGAAILVGVLVVGSLAGVPETVPPVHAYACQAPSVCYPASATKTSALSVDHALVNTQPVQPNTGETWSIAAYWNSNVPPCDEHSETASVTVSWGGSSWVLSNANYTSNIIAFGLCTVGGRDCPASPTHSYGYKLIVKVNDPVVIETLSYNSRKVDYTTTSVAGGNDLDMSPCSLGTSRTPTSQSFSQTDSNITYLAGRCPFTCDVDGASITITYY